MSILFYNFSGEIHLPDQVRELEIVIGIPFFRQALSYAWHNDSCFPGQDRLSADMGMTRPRVTQLIAELQKKGLITIQRRGQGKTNVYRVHFKVQERKRPVRRPPDIQR